MDHSVHLPKKIGKSQIKKSINLTIKGKQKRKKSPALKYKNKQIRSRSQSKTVAKYYPSKDNSFCKLNHHQKKFPLYSTRTIGFRSKTPNIGRLKGNKKSNTSRFHKKESQLRKISENKIIYSDIKKNIDCYFKNTFESFPYPGHSKNEENTQKNYLGTIEGYHIFG
jgi:hypothetical protein